MSDSWIGKIVGNCRIDKKIGEGGCGSVYRGVDLMLERPVAVKVLHGGLASRRDVAERFRTEAHTLARLSHPNVATLYSFHREADTYLMVMEFVEGKTLDELILEHGRLSPEQALPLFRQALQGIHHAHLAGVIHRDLKGSNVMRSDSGLVKVMDFGIARALWSPSLTQADHPLGTPEYMSPEQVHAQEIDARADIYSLGALLFKMLTGRVPFSGDSPYEIMRAQVEQMPPSVRDFSPEIPEALDEVIQVALAKSRDERFESAGALEAALEEIYGKPETAFESERSPAWLPAPLSDVGAPDSHTTPIPLEDLATEGARGLIARHEGPTHIVGPAEPWPGQRSPEPGLLAWLEGFARASARRLAPVASVPGAAGLAVALLLVGLAPLSVPTWKPIASVEAPAFPREREVSQAPVSEEDSVAVPDGAESNAGTDGEEAAPTLADPEAAAGERVAPPKPGSPPSPRRRASRRAEPAPSRPTGDGWVIRRR